MSHLIFTDGLLYESETSYYRRRMSASKFNYQAWEERCFGEFNKVTLWIQVAQHSFSHAIMFTYMGRKQHGFLLCTLNTSHKYMNFWYVCVLHSTFSSWKSSLALDVHIYKISLWILDLGTGWDPVIVDDTAELEFIKSQERLSTDNRNYWLGGLAYQTVGGTVWPQKYMAIKVFYMFSWPMS